VLLYVIGVKSLPEASLGTNIFPLSFMLIGVMGASVSPGAKYMELFRVFQAIIQRNIHFVSNFYIQNLI